MKGCICIKTGFFLFRKKWHLLYIGRIGNTGLAERVIDWHFDGMSVGPSLSTLRESLACLLGIRLIQTGENRYGLSAKNSAKLSRWLKSNARVLIEPTNDYEAIEAKLISRVNPPLNIYGSNHSFTKELSRLRAKARSKAKIHWE